jgi:hypothetical protein
VKIHLALSPGEYFLVADVSRYPDIPCLIGSAGRVEDWQADAAKISFRCCGPIGAVCALRIKASKPLAILAEGQEAPYTYDDFSGTLLIKLPGNPDGISVDIIQ